MGKQIVDNCLGDLMPFVALVGAPGPERATLAAGLAARTRVELFDTAAALLESDRRSWISAAVVDVDSVSKAAGAVGALATGPHAHPTLAIGTDGDARTAVAVLRAGAADYVFKPASPEQVWERLGQICAPDGVRADVAEMAVRLSPRERVVLAMLRRGLSTKEIALALALSPRTVEVHRSRILAKTGARRTTDLLVRASRSAAA